MIDRAVATSGHPVLIRARFSGRSLASARCAIPRPFGDADDRISRMADIRRVHGHVGRRMKCNSTSDLRLPIAEYGGCPRGELEQRVVAMRNEPKESGGVDHRHGSRGAG